MLTLLSVCEDMFQLNILNRSRKSQYRFEIYYLKNALVKYLYQKGFCVEALLHCQKFECWPCGGTGEFWTGEVCHKCGGSGVFREVWHYAFRFEVNGRRFSWHQPKAMLDFKVQLTPGLPELYKDPALPPKDDIDLFLDRANVSIWNVALFLWLHGYGSLDFRQMPVTREFVWKLDSIKWRIELIGSAIHKKLRRWILHDDLDDIPF